jgi:hypothetical protein
MPSRIIHRQGDYFSLLGKFSNSGNYYHWIHDCLLRLHGVEGHLPQGVKYLVPKGYVTTSLRRSACLDCVINNLFPFTEMRFGTVNGFGSPLFLLLELKFQRL